MLRQSATNERFDAVFEKELKGWAEANANASDREYIGTEGLQREFTKEKVKMVVDKHYNNKAAGPRGRIKSECIDEIRRRRNA